MPATEEVIGDAVKSGDIKIVGETYTDNWEPSKAQTKMEQILTRPTTTSRPCWSENDGMAGGVVAALQAQGLAGKVPGVRSGRRPGGAQPRRARHPDRRRLEGRPPARRRPPARLRSSSARTPTSTEVTGTAPFTTPGGIDVRRPSVKPQPITKDNLNVVIDAGWTTKENVCKGVAAGSVSVCG